MRRQSSIEVMSSPWLRVAGILSVIGALNWGFIGLFNFNLVRSLFGPMTMFSRLIYTIVGISGLYLLFSLFSVENQQQRPWQRWMR